MRGESIMSKDEAVPRKLPVREINSLYVRLKRIRRSLDEADVCLSEIVGFLDEQREVWKS